MGSLMGTKTPPKSASELEMEKRLAEEKKKAKEENEALIAAEKKRKKRQQRGMIGSRSLFTRAGGRGFYAEGKEID